MKTSASISIVIFCLIIPQIINCLPIRNKRSIETNGATNCNYQTQCNVLSQANSKKAGTATKKDVFMSRGWAAGGMPFNVLYLTPHGSKATPMSEPIAEPYRSPVLMQPQHDKKENSMARPYPQMALRNNIGNGRSGSSMRRPYSVIPQLFVSYGWGPHGKK